MKQKYEYINYTNIRNHKIHKCATCDPGTDPGTGAKCALVRTLSIDVIKHKLCDAIKQLPQSGINVEQQADLENVRNLMFVRSLIEGFNHTAIDCIIQYITGY